MTGPEQHQRLRERLGSLALGHLSPGEDDALRAHLDGCASCRAELAEMATVVSLLDGVDPAAFASPPSPPPGLGARIRDAVAAEAGARAEARAQALTEALAEDELTRRRTAQRDRARRRAVVAAAAVVLVVGVGAGAFLGRTTAPGAPAAAPVPFEPVILEEVDDGPVAVDSAGLVPHTWGVELRMEAAGFVEGAVYRAAFRDQQGRLQPAGRFVGTGTSSMSCNLQAGVLREDVRAVVVLDDRGRTVLRSRL